MALAHRGPAPWWYSGESGRSIASRLARHSCGHREEGRRRAGPETRCRRAVRGSETGMPELLLVALVAMGRRIRGRGRGAGEVFGGGAAGRSREAHKETQAWQGSGAGDGEISRRG